jgi:hypothetical protein
MKELSPGKPLKGIKIRYEPGFVQSPDGIIDVIMGWPVMHDIVVNAFGLDKSLLKGKDYWEEGNEWLYLECNNKAQEAKGEIS